MIPRYRDTESFDGWLTESAAALRHNSDPWVTVRELVGDFAALNFEFNGVPVANLDEDQTFEFRNAMHSTLHDAIAESAGI